MKNRKQKQKSKTKPFKPKHNEQTQMVSQYAKLMARDATKKFDRERSRQLALHWYRKILRAGEKWEGSAQEKEYIKHEARKLFRQVWKCYGRTNVMCIALGL